MKQLLLGLVAFSSVGFADPLTLKTDDRNEEAYRWDKTTCTVGASDLSIYTPKAADGSQVHFYFRNRAAYLEALTTSDEKLEVKTTKMLGLTFQDREGTVWAFQPTRNNAFCNLNFKKSADGELSLWGKCDKLTPKDPSESFSQAINIAEESPLKCRLVKGQP